MQDTKKDQTDFSEYLRPLRARWWLIAIIALVAAVGTYRYYSGKPVTYSATTSLYMQGNNTAALTGGQTAQSDPTFIANQALLLHTEAVAAVAAQSLGFHGDPSILLNAVNAHPTSGTDFMNVSATAPNAVDAGKIANAFARAYISTQESNSQKVIAEAVKAQQARLSSLPNDVTHAEQRNQVASIISALQLQQSIPTAPAKQVQPAGLGAPSASNPTSHAIYALILGLLIGSGIAYALDALDRRVKRVTEIEELYGAPVIAKVPWALPKVSGGDPRMGLQAPLAESFRALRTSLQLRARPHGNGNGNGNGHGAGVGPLQTLLVTSAVPGEGKSTIVRNLALAYLEAGHRVAVVDCDLRRPDLTRSFGVEPMPGLPEILTGTATVADCLQTIEVAGNDLETMVRARRGTRQESMYLVASAAGRDEFALRRVVDSGSEASDKPELAVLPSSVPQWNPAAIFTAGGLHDVLSTLKADYDIVILDTSPLAAVTDAAPLLSMVDGVLIVTRLKKSPIPAVREMLSVFERVPHSNVVGIVANDLRDRESASMYSRPYGEKS